MSEAMCRVCLAENIKMHSIRNTQLQEVYEKLSNGKLITGDGRPEAVCSTCYSQLDIYNQFSLITQKADDMLTQLYHNGFKLSSDEIGILHRTRDSLGFMWHIASSGSTKPLASTASLASPGSDSMKLFASKASFASLGFMPDNYSGREIAHLDKNPHENDLDKNLLAIVKTEQDLVKIETACSNEKYVFEDVKIEDTTNGDNPKRTQSLNEKHQKYSIYSCNNCIAKFKNKTKLKAHIKTHEQPNSDLNKTELNKRLSEKRNSFTNETAMNERECRLNDTPSIENSLQRKKRKVKNKESFTCDRCGKAFPTGYQLRRHMNSHTRDHKHPCLQCSKKFPDNCTLRKHRLTHTGEKPHACAECGATYAQKGNLTRHMRSHTGETPFLCGICRKPQADASHLRLHMRIHTGEKPFVCETCGKAYSDENNLRRHRRYHTGEKPYVCKICDYKSAHANCLKLHLSSKHCVKYN